MSELMKTFIVRLFARGVTGLNERARSTGLCARRRTEHRWVEVSHVAAPVEVGVTSAGGPFLAGGDHETRRREHLATEVGRVERHRPYGFVDAAQVGDGEGLLDEA